MTFVSASLNNTILMSFIFTSAKYQVTNRRLESACYYFQIVTYEGPFEIVSLVGTVSGGEGGHLHISLSDSKGQVIGGHVVGDLFIYTTAEVVLGECEGVRFERAHDKETGYEELVICAE